MISTANLMLVGVDQTGVHPASADQRETNGISFAQSFDERVGFPVEPLGKDTTTEVMTGLLSAKDEPHVKITNAVSTMPLEAARKAVAALEVPEHGEMVEGVVGRDVPSQKTALLASQTKTRGLDSEPKDIQSPADAERTDKSFTFPQDATIPRSNNEPLLPQLNAEWKPLAPSSEAVVVQRGTAPTTDDALEFVPAKKIIKSEQGESALMILHKITTTQHPVEVAAGPVPSPVAQGSDPMLGHMFDTIRMPAVDASVTPEGEPGEGLVGRVPVVDKSSLTATFAAKNSLARKEVTGGKTTGVDVEAKSPSLGEEAGFALSGAGVEKVPSVAVLESGDSEVRRESASAVVISVAHATAPGNASSDASVIKLGFGETGSHTAGLPMELREQDRSVSVDGSVDGMPQMLTATPTALEVGIQNGTHGWLKVRAEMAEAGVVNASVSASSVTGREMLHRELPGLTSFLQSEKVAVNAIVVHPMAAESRGAASGREDGSGGQMQQGGNDGGGHQKGINETALDGVDEDVSYESLNGIDDDGASPLATYVGGGSWLSVRA
jgi:hypothetical protein